MEALKFYESIFSYFSDHFYAVVTADTIIKLPFSSRIRDQDIQEYFILVCLSSFTPLPQIFKYCSESSDKHFNRRMFEADWCWCASERRRRRRERR